MRYDRLYNVYVAQDLESAGIRVSAINYQNNTLLVVVPTRDWEEAEDIVLDTLDSQGVEAYPLQPTVDANLTNLYFEV